VVEWSRSLLVLFVTIAMAASASLPADSMVCNRYSDMHGDCDSDCCASHACGQGCSPLSRVSKRWFGMNHYLEECGIEFEGAITQFYQGVASGGIEHKFRYGGHGDYGLDLDMGKICGLDRVTIELGSEHRFAETVNSATGSVVPVALLPNLPEPETDVLALTEIRFNFEVHEDIEVFCGKLDTLVYDRNLFADGNGAEKFLSTAFIYNPIATRTVPFSTLGGGISWIRNDEPVFTLAVLDTEDTGTIMAIDELFAKGVVIFSEVRFPVTFMGRR
jgi:porin